MHTFEPEPLYIFLSHFAHFLSTLKLVGGGMEKNYLLLFAAKNNNKLDGIISLYMLHGIQE